MPSFLSSPLKCSGEDRGLHIHVGGGGAGSPPSVYGGVLPPPPSQRKTICRDPTPILAGSPLDVELPDVFLGASPRFVVPLNSCFVTRVGVGRTVGHAKNRTCLSKTPRAEQWFSFSRSRSVGPRGKLGQDVTISLPSSRSDDAQQNMVGYVAEVDVVILAKGPRRAPVQKGLGHFGIHHAHLGCESGTFGRWYTQFLLLPHLLIHTHYTRFLRAISAIASGGSLLYLPVPPRDERTPPFACSTALRHRSPFCLPAPVGMACTRSPCCFDAR